MGFGGIPIQRIDAKGTKNLMKQLMEEGVNYIDTARGYTVSEEYLGYALEGIRDKFVLATKSMARTKEAMAADIEKSLGNLRTGHIDLYQVHNPSMEQLDTVVGEGGALEALLEAKAAGKIGHIGLTAHSTAVFERALGLDWVETIMFPYNIVESQGDELIRKCQIRLPALKRRIMYKFLFSAFKVQKCLHHAGHISRLVPDSCAAGLRCRHCHRICPPKFI